MSDRIAVFNQGRIEQVGPPAEVYDRPATEFVAGFVGTSSILARGGRRLVLRPEKLRLAATPFAGDGWHSEPGVLTDSVYVGLFTRHIVRLDAGETVVAVEQNAGPAGPTLRRGAPVQVGWRPADVFELTTG